MPPTRTQCAQTRAAPVPTLSTHTYDFLEIGPPVRGKLLSRMEGGGANPEATCPPIGSVWRAVGACPGVQEARAQGLGTLP